MIDKNSPLPIYSQIEECIKGQIVNGELKPGDVLPPEREYSEQFDVSRMTIRQAINNLVNEGLIYRKKGSGTYVAEKKFEQPLQGLTSFTEDMKARGLTPSSKLLKFELIPASAKVAATLQIAEYTPVYEIKRIRLADNIPMALETCYISANLIKGLTEEIINQSLYQYIEEKLRLVIGEATQVIESALANDAEVDLLNINKGDSILLIERCTYLNNGTPFEIVRSSYRADRYRFTSQLKRY
ncbi:GntR family transcriptional regulator [Alkalihalophilus lindianensis]|uniref:GntR family transcriptional regulator n=1 Tax=Alkalihalophilus lindianensis TaxID=1630542 RepID=A0ABU3XCE8_9BACI|nr:GntR family transcriptional regulator [Alkalihalophilus lindianensis]MDV2685551.1 GntR family transcriptional regulator [Alkalihalophilus lindianensis]